MYLKWKFACIHITRYSYINYNRVAVGIVFNIYFNIRINQTPNKVNCWLHIIIFNCEWTGIIAFQCVFQTCHSFYDIYFLCTGHTIVCNNIQIKVRQFGCIYKWWVALSINGIIQINCNQCVLIICQFSGIGSHV